MPSPVNSDGEISANEAARRANVCRRTVKKWIANREFEARDIGTGDRPYWRIDPKSFASFLESRRIGRAHPEHQENPPEDTAISRDGTEAKADG